MNHQLKRLNQKKVQICVSSMVKSILSYWRLTLNATNSVKKGSILGAFPWQITGPPSPPPVLRDNADMVDGDMVSHCTGCLSTGGGGALACFDPAALSCLLCSGPDLGGRRGRATSTRLLLHPEVTSWDDIYNRLTPPLAYSPLPSCRAPT